MKQLSLCVALLTAALLWALPVHAGNYIINGVAQTDNNNAPPAYKVLGSGLTNNFDGTQLAPEGGTPWVIFTRWYPEDATNSAALALGNLELVDTSNPSDGNKICGVICAGVVKNGQDLANLNLTACTPQIQVTVSAANTAGDVILSNIGVGLTPKDTTGTVCTAAACKGAPMTVQFLQQACSTGANTTDHVYLKALHYTSS